MLCGVAFSRFSAYCRISYNHDVANSKDKEFEIEGYDSDLRSKQLHAWRPKGLDGCGCAKYRRSVLFTARGRNKIELVAIWVQIEDFSFVLHLSLAMLLALLESMYMLVKVVLESMLQMMQLLLKVVLESMPSPFGKRAQTRTGPASGGTESGASEHNVIVCSWCYRAQPFINDGGALAHYLTSAAELFYLRHVRSCAASAFGNHCTSSAVRSGTCRSGVAVIMEFSILAFTALS